jgi:hypothetical protein
MLLLPPTSTLGRGEASRSRCLKCLKSSSRRADRLTDLAAQRQGDLRGKAHVEPLLSLDVRKAFRALHPGPGKWPGLSLHYQLMRLCRFAEQIALPRPSPQSSLPHTGRTPPPLSIPRLCPSIHTLSCERIPSGHSGERAITPRPSVRASGRTCESNHCAALPNRPPGLASLARKA